MKANERAAIERISIELVYPDKSRHTKVIEGEQLEQLALIAFNEKAVAESLAKHAQQKRALKDFRHGKKGNGKPAMMLLYSDGSFSLECDWESHHPGRTKS